MGSAEAPGSGSTRFMESPMTAYPMASSRAHAAEFLPQFSAIKGVLPVIHIYTFVPSAFCSSRAA